MEESKRVMDTLATRNAESKPAPGQPAQGIGTESQPAQGLPAQGMHVVGGQAIPRRMPEVERSISIGSQEEGNAASSSKKRPSDKLVVRFQAGSARERERTRQRDEFKQASWLKGLPRWQVSFKNAANIVPMPPICNRVATDWKVADKACQCHKWPKWLQRNKAKVKKDDFCTDADGVTQNVAAQDKVLFWRPGEKKKRWWFDGVVLEALSVVFPSGAQDTIVGIN